MNLAVKDFLDGYLCSEAIVKNFTDDKSLLKTATGFGAGIAYTNNLCGALSGGVLVLSHLKGRSTKDTEVDGLFKDIQELNESFEQKFGSCNCPKLLGFSFSDIDGAKKFEEQDCKNQKCAKYIEFVADKTQELLNK